MSSLCASQFQHLKNDFSALYDHSLQHTFETDFVKCSNTDISVQICSSQISSNMFCFPRSCQNDEIHEIMRKNLGINMQTMSNHIECRNLYDPTMLYAFLLLFFTSTLTFSILAVLFEFNKSKALLPYINPLKPRIFKFLSVFSLSENLKTLFDTKTSSTSINCIHGIKALSMMLIVMRHSFQIVTNFQKVPRDIDYQRRNIKSMHTTGILATDTFFVISGILAAKYFISRKHLFSRFLQNFFQRYMRMVPSGIIVMACFLAVKFLLMESHPNYFYDPEIDNCRKYWWTSVLQIQTYWNVDDMCFGSFWFATVSIHLFFVTPFFLLILRYLNTFFGLIFGLFVAFSTQYPAYQELQEILVNGKEVAALVAGFRYTETITRSYPYFIGLFYYWLSTKLPQNEKSSFHKLIQIFGWITAFYVLIETLNITNSDITNLNDLNIEFLRIRLCWPFMLCWIIHACHNGFGGIIDHILSAKLWMVLSNLSLGIYLLNDHTNLYLAEWRLKTPAAYDFWNVAYIWFLTYTFDIMASIVLFLLVEVPFHRLSTCKF